MLDATLQSAFVVILAALIKAGAKAIYLPLDDTTVNSLAAVIVVYIFSKLFPPAVKGFWQKS